MQARRFLSLFLRVGLAIGALGAAPGVFWAQDAVTPDSAAAQTENATATQTPQAALESLIVVLRDPDARAALIAELEAGLSAEDATPADTGTPAQETEETAEAEDEPQVTPSAELRSLGARIADVTRAAVGGITLSLGTLWDQLAAAPAIFAAFDPADLAALRDVAGHLLILAGVTYGGFFLLRALCARMRERLRASFAAGGWVAKPVALLFELALDLAAVLVPYALGYGAAVGILGTTGEIEFEYSLYLNAFVMLEGAMAVLRTIISPTAPAQRLIAVNDAEARALMIWGRVLIGLFVFGQLMVLPLVNTTISFPAGRAVSVIIMLLTLAIAAIGVGLARKPVRNRLVRLISHKEMRRGLGGILAYWHVAAFAYLAVLAIVALTRVPVAFQGFLWANGQIALAVLGGAIVLSILKRWLGSGIVLPEATRQRYPELERQLNGVTPVLLRVFRAAIVFWVAAFALARLGLFSFGAFVGSEFGARITGSTLTIAVILGIAGVCWVAVNAWVDTQINPERAPNATARKRTLFILFRNALTIAIVAVTLMLVLSEIGINIAPLLASAGVIGLAVGFGAQRLVQDIITGIFIQLEGAIDVGDVVSVAGISGVVERLTIRSVSLRDSEGSYHVIPFSTVAAVTNFMRGFSYAVVDVTVPYKQSVAEVKAAMSEAFERLKKESSQGRHVRGGLEWDGVNSFSLADLGVRARIKTAPGRQWGVKRSYNTLLRDAFLVHFIGVPETERPSVSPSAPEAETPAPAVPEGKTRKEEEIALPDPDAGPNSQT